MNEVPMPTATSLGSVADAAAGTRAEFIRKTYLHLGGAILAFVALEALLFQIPGIENVVATMAGGKGWLLILGGFMLVSWIANKWASSTTSLGMQYLGLGLYVVAEAILFLPLLWVAAVYGGPLVIPGAAVMTLALFGGLTATVLFTRWDFSFLRMFLVVGGFVAMGLIVCSILFGFDLGLLFTGVMIAFAGAAVLYNTSNVLHHYRVGQHVAAALALFAAVALLFWYVLRLLLAFGRR